METAGKSFHGERLGEAGNAFEKNVAVGEEAHQQAIDEFVLADEDASHFGS